MMTIKTMYLTEACRKGDPIAQLQVYKLYFNQMFNISIKHVKNVDAADKIVKESFLVVFDKIRTCNSHIELITRLKKQVEERSVEAWKRNNVTFPGLVTDRRL